MRLSRWVLCMPESPVYMLIPARLPLKLLSISRATLLHAREVSTALGVLMKKPQWSPHLECHIPESAFLSA